MRRSIRVTGFAFAVLLISACGLPVSSPLTVEILNRDDIVRSGDLKIKVCFTSEIQYSELAVNIYVTERKEWSDLGEVMPYTRYFNEQFVSIPGTISQPVSKTLWQPAAGTFCHAAFLEDAFVDTAEWIRQGVCPFKGMVVVANYKKGAWNAANVIECEFPS